MHIQCQEFYQNEWCKLKNCGWVNKPKCIIEYFSMPDFLSRQLRPTSKRCISITINVEFDFFRFHNFFNWTMTYRLDSDIYRPYGWLSERKSQEVYPSPKLQWMTPPESGTDQVTTKHKKTKMVAWIVSNCNTHSNR